MIKTAVKTVCVFLCLVILVTAVLSVNVYSGLIADKAFKPITGWDNDVAGTTVDNTAGITSGPAGDILISIGEEGLEAKPGSLLHGTSYIGGGIIKWGGFYIGAFDTTRDTYDLIYKPSEHSSSLGKFADKGLLLANNAMGWASVIGGAIAIFTVTATAPATGTLAVVTGTTFAVYTMGVSMTRAVVNSEPVKNIEDVLTGKKKVVFAPFERPDIREARNIIKEELGFDPYDRSDNEIPDPNTGIPVYKPNIYIYSNVDMDVNVKIYPYSYITESLPYYDQKTGWNSRIINGSINGKNDYLFYEAAVPDDGFQKEYGWILHSGGLKQEMAAMLDGYGFNQKEKSDFIDYWARKLKKNTDYVFYPQESRVVDGIMPLIITPKPDNTFRLWFYIKPFKDESAGNIGKVSPDPIQRTDYTVVEWGGMIGR